jgi:hypothetical protein
MHNLASQDAGAGSEEGDVKYTHKLSSRSDNRAGARERAGFIDAPEIGPANSASKAITDPTATPA